VLQDEHQVIWTATSGAKAVELCLKQTPDLILLELMAGMDGADTTRRIMASTPCAILLVTASVRVNAGLVFEAMGCGALDAIDTPVLAGGNLQQVAAPLLAKIDVLAGLIGKQDIRSAARRRGGALTPRYDRLNRHRRVRRRSCRAGDTAARASERLFPLQS
jgi:two-component system response regulator WspF